MSIEAALYNRLTGDNDVASEVGTRVYPTDLPESPTLPALTYQIISHIPVLSHDTGPANARTMRVQIVAWTDDRFGLIALREAVVNTLDGWRDQSADPRIDRCQWLDGSDSRVPEVERYRDDLDFMIHYAP
jgi:hypothetical protein